MKAKWGKGGSRKKVCPDYVSLNFSDNQSAQYLPEKLKRKYRLESKTYCIKYTFLKFSFQVLKSKQPDNSVYLTTKEKNAQLRQLYCGKLH